MYKPVVFCNRCTRPPPGMSAGALASKRLREAGARIWRGRGGNVRRPPTAPPPKTILKPVDKTQQLYRVPRIRMEGDEKLWSEECVTWPRYRYGHYAMDNTGGTSLLELEPEEAKALRIVCLFTQKRAEKFFKEATHHQNWKKVGLSRAKFNDVLVEERSMPSAKAKAAFRFLMDHNKSK